MITKNFKIFNKHIMTLNNKYSSASNAEITVPEITDINGVKHDKIALAPNIPFMNFVQLLIENSCTYSEETPSSSNRGCSIWLGTNDDDETEDDYMIEAIGTDVLESKNSSCSRYIDGDKIVLDFTRSFKNVSSSPLSVSEVGFLKTIAYSTLTDGVAFFLFDRRKLPEPVVIEPQQEKPFNMVYEF